MTLYALMLFERYNVFYDDNSKAELYKELVNCA